MVELVVEELVGHTAVDGKMIVCDLCTCPTGSKLKPISR